MTRLRSFFAATDDPYAGGDLATACRLAAQLWRLSVVLVVILMPLAPPTAAVGPAGWAIMALSLMFALVAARRLADPGGGVTWDELLSMSYIAVVQIAGTQWLAGRAGASAYGELYLLVCVYAGSVHPPRRLVGVLGAVAVASTLPLLYEDLGSGQIALTATRLLLWSGLGLVASALMRAIRAQRLGLRSAGERAEQLARVDELTELPNRRAFEEALPAEMSRARRFGSPLCLVMADLDGFKAINDEHGHLAGDECLRDVAEALRDELRQHDACFRWGGDEFALLMPATTRTEADGACGRLSAAVAERCREPGGAPVSLACAAAQLTDGMTGEDLIRAADAALRARKSARPAPRSAEVIPLRPRR
jgi:diguanylate cyclase (GGDEF)-like protein